MYFPSKEFEILPSCEYAKVIRIPGWKIILCKNKKGKKLDCSIPLLNDKEVCVGIESKLNPTRIIPDLSINLEKITNCRYRKKY